MTSLFINTKKHLTMQIDPGRIEHIELPDGTTIEIDCSNPTEYNISHLDPDNEYTLTMAIEPAI